MPKGFQAPITIKEAIDKLMKINMFCQVFNDVSFGEKIKLNYFSTVL